jgi:acetolactate synthase-1/2/3 large subunit
LSDRFRQICDALTAVGVDCVFGVPGTQNVELFEALRQSGIRTVLATHELAAAFMANGYFRASGKPAVLTTIPGPGFTYALTGIAEARLDSAALIYIVGRPATEPGQRFQLQAIDQTSIATPLVKAILTLSPADDPFETVRAAYDLAIGGEPGPVMIHADFGKPPREGSNVPGPIAVAVPTSEPQAALGEFDVLFRNAQRPVFILGQGAHSNAARLRAIVDRLRIPVITTSSARGIVPETSALAMGFDSVRGHVASANALFARADLIVALGCKLGHNGSSGFSLRLPPDKLVHVDASSSVVGANYPARLGIVAPVDSAMASLEGRVTATAWPADEIASLRAALRSSSGKTEPLVRARGEAIGVAEFFHRFRRELPADAIVVTDSGEHQIFARRHLDIESVRGLMLPSDLQSMGFGLPAAIGAAIAAPARPTVAIVGDGGFLMSGLELLTARREDAPLVVLVFNNGSLGQIRTQQHREFGYGHAVELLNPDFEAIAAATGIAYVPFHEASSGWLASALASMRVTLVVVVLGESASRWAAPIVRRAKNVARAVVRPGVLDWVRHLARRGKAGRPRTP